MKTTEKHKDVSVIDGMLVLGFEDCYCNDGRERTKTVPCRDCGGTGKGPRGGKGGCKKCHGSGRDYVPVEWDIAANCSRCDGTGRVEMDSTSFMPEWFWQDFEFRVVTEKNKRLSWTTANIGLGCISACVDYGSAAKMVADGREDELIAEVKNGSARHSNQFCKIIRSKDDWTIASWIGVHVGADGYALLPHFEEN